MVTYLTSCDIAPHSMIFPVVYHLRCHVAALALLDRRYVTSRVDGFKRNLSDFEPEE